MPELPLNNARCIVQASCHKLLLDLAHSHRLHNVAELEAFSYIFPFLLVLLWSLKLDRALSVHFHETSSDRRAFLLYLTTVAYCCRQGLNNRLTSAFLCMNAITNPLDQRYTKALVTAEMQAAKRLRLAQQCGDLFDGWDIEATTFEV